MRLIRFADLPSTPWKNGGGTTTEIATSPPGAGLEDFDWRVSIASVAGDGPFSLFPGIDRTLTLIEGSGLTMTVDGSPPLTLTEASEPLAFPGDVPVSARLVAGPIRDFNVMTRRGRYDHRVGRHDPRSGPVVPPSGGIHLIVSLGKGSFALGGEPIAVAFGDVIEIGDGDPAIIEGPHPILVVRLTAHE